jgi:flagellar motor switch protein FliN/FliY
MTTKNTSPLRAATLVHDTPAAAPDAEAPVAAQVLSFSELDHVPAANAPLVVAGNGAVNPLHHIKAMVTVCVGAAELTVGELLAAREQQVLRLDRGVESPVDILLEGQVIARGVLMAVDDHFGVRITELPRPLTP